MAQSKVSRLTSRPRLPERLQRGRHSLTKSAVATAQIERIYDAIACAVAIKGIRVATVADVIAHARVSRKTFYEHFPGIDECFLAAYKHSMRRLFGMVQHAVREASVQDWRDRTRVSIEAYLAALAGAPEATWAFTIENLGGGIGVLQMRAWVLQRWVEQWRVLQTMRESAKPSTPAVPDASLLAMVGGIEELVRECLYHRGARRLPELTPVITEFVLSILDRTPVPATRSRSKAAAPKTNRRRPGR